MGHTTESVSPGVRADVLSGVVDKAQIWVGPTHHDAFGHNGDVVWVEPVSEAHVSAVLQLANREGWTVSPIGAGTQLFTGHPGQLPDVVMSLRQMNHIVEYSPSDMVITVQAGTPMQVLHRTLREQNQMLPLDPVVSDEVTVGGVISTAVSGPRRALYGTVRDMVIGLRTVYPNGDIVRVGGKVVKNVAGYDMTKLFTGSQGSLAVITEATFKLRPLPMHRETVLLTGELEQITELRRRIVNSYLIPSRFELLHGHYANVPGIDSGDWGVAVDCDENESSASGQTARLQAWAGDLRMQTHVYRRDESEEWWALYHRTLLRGKLSVRVTAPPSSSTNLLQEALGGLPSDSQFQLSFGLSTGVGHIYLDTAEPVPLAQWVAKMRPRFADLGGNLVLERAPSEVRSRVDSFGPVGAVEALLKGIKATIDPQRILNPGRFVGGI